MKRQLYDMQFLYWEATGKHVTLIGRIVTKRRYKMEEYLVCEMNLVYGNQLKKARRLTEEEKTHYMPWFRENLEYLSLYQIREILGDRDSDGKFVSSSGDVYIVSQDEWNKMIKMNEEQGILKKKKDLKEKIEDLQYTIERCESAKKLYTREEAQAERKRYNNLFNEGGEGFVPHFYTVEEYEWAKENLKEYQKELSELGG